MGVWFILTGEVVPEGPVRISYVTLRQPGLTRTTITLELEGWVPPEAVLEQYRHAQREIFGKTPRSPIAKTLNVFEFVNRHKKEKAWRELLEAWNAEYPFWSFKDRSHLYTSYDRALEYVASPADLP
jgi:hypothetical protein